MGLILNRFPHYRQSDSSDCGPTCLRIISKYYGKHFTLRNLRKKANINRDGVSLLGISRAAESIGYRTVGAKVSYDTLVREQPFPCIAHWNEDHFIVVYQANGQEVKVSDPARGLISYRKEEFTEKWARSLRQDENEGLVLVLEPTPRFYASDEASEDEQQGALGFGLIFRYLLQYKRLILQLVLSILGVSLIQLIFPFITRNIVDKGIKFNDLSVIYVLLAAQLMLFAGRTSIDFIRSWILLHVSSRVNISLVSDFFIKLMRLPLSYFDAKFTGDILQRVTDHQRVERFLTVSSLNFVFSLITLVVFSIVLAIYSPLIFGVFIFATVAYAVWVLFFLARRKKLDYRRFDAQSVSSSQIVQMVTGMQEIKLNNSEQKKRWQWENTQASLYKVNVESLTLGQYQQAGAFFINEGKNIIITFLAAKLVIENTMTLGTMLAIQYIIGQLNTPVEKFVEFIKSYQDAKISIDRLNEIHEQKDEQAERPAAEALLPFNKDIRLEDVSFAYPGTEKQPALRNVTLTLPHGKTTAIVGASGSGKTTLLKLLLNFYVPQSGRISVGGTPLDRIDLGKWREYCGTVMQEGFIFSDTIAENIAVSDEKPDVESLVEACEMANIMTFVDSLPLGFNTKIGSEGNGLSAGQRQRILIARAIYKDPEFLLFDEATNALDANNEREIVEKLDKFFERKTVVVVAHRLSTVQNADQIVVLDQGQIVERGSHRELTAARGHYYRLVKNQLELGS